MKYTSTLFFLFFASTLYANDSVIYEDAGNFFPMQESQIALSKEELRFTRDGWYMRVDVTFTFHNPDDSSRTVQMAFVTEPPMGDVGDNPTRIEDFTVKVDDKLTPHSVRRIAERSKVRDMDFSGDEFLYMFEVEFKPGLTSVKHSCRVPFGSVYYTDYFHYILETGLLWSNKEIGDFSLSIELGPNVYFSVPAFLHDSSDTWEINGTGRIEDHVVNVGESPVRRVYLRKGTLNYQKRNFKPQRNLSFHIGKDVFSLFMPYATLSKIDRMIADMALATSWGSMEDIGFKDYRLYRNLLYALHGYVFESAELRDFFSQAYWYIPGEKTQNDNIDFSERELRLLEMIRKMESADR